MVRYSLADATDLLSFDENSNLLNMNIGMNFNTPHEPLPTNPPGNNDNTMTKPMQYNPNIELNSLENDEKDNMSVIGDNTSEKKMELKPFQQMNRDFDVKDKLPITSRGLADNTIVRERKPIQKEFFQQKALPVQQETQNEASNQNDFYLETKSLYITIIAFAIIILCMYIYKRSWN